ncbi:MAG: hypothetical protein DMG04_10255 [Acidobacteria bacterium]|nr:MAG: hypothetical protein DMG04_10255 [Acidobacteriota bacterium]PYQ90239.1 MAG: hypothetical protein DMG03_00950 [Acidobacteriota bacterium]PYR07780.1 MAG: hypothetical protein DMF99_21360 [Acidobacteriota bacterium]
MAPLCSATMESFKLFDLRGSFHVGANPLRTGVRFRQGRRVVPFGIMCCVSWLREQNMTASEYVVEVLGGSSVFKGRAVPTSTELRERIKQGLQILSRFF